MIIAIYKPLGMTSHDVVKRVREATGERRVGHAGTLDPLAEGVLVVGVGREATRKLHEVVGGEKEYVATIRLGATSVTDDEEGPKTERAGVAVPPRKEVASALRKFVGAIKQTPPRYSAVKVRGKPSYAYARSGKDIALKPRMVEVKDIKLVAYEYPLITLRVVTGPGVYIRSIARDLGETLGTGGYLAGLVRTRVGEFGIDAARPLDRISKALGVQ
ncbi:MAG: tRNA pseudouridine(55) synthase TruB [Candidatus Colwellbacteria bacterium]|nr:tRNA pseudouridine(55) synthase TruB [Candidatus Colwellbacteria bacterium]